MYHLCEKYYKPLRVQYYTANCVSWVPRLTLLDLQTIWTYECALRNEARSLCRGLAVVSFKQLRIFPVNYLSRMHEFPRAAIIILWLKALEIYFLSVP